MRSIPTIIDFIAKSYDMDIVNEYELKGLVTIKSQNMNARQAINTLDSTIEALGYTLLESVRGDPPRVVLTVLPTRAVPRSFPSTTAATRTKFPKAMRCGRRS